ncbi:MAG: 4Fe-4S dicluster domain-containing protein [Methanobrevibacter olleyae]|uniref:4Fe-4S dicluster domain-containing protein n=1 Tax=Methanobrevibacter olleyae TaxID=294671 RepID=A0A8T3VM19_METOL|nr:4Fe-4S dicluster domain-containing protein [Methanobrevibacter olleyae]
MRYRDESKKRFWWIFIIQIFPKSCKCKQWSKSRRKKCILCKKCASVCPTRSIHIDKENRKWYFTPKTCIKCYKCKMACPKNAIRIMP